MKQPKLLAAVGLFGFVVLLGFFWTGMKQSNQKNNAQEQASSQTQKAFDVAAGDTNNEVLKMIVAKQKALQAVNNKQAELIDQLQRENQGKSSQAMQAQQTQLLNEIAQTRDMLTAQFDKKIADLKAEASRHETSGHPQNGAYPTDGAQRRNAPGHQVISDVPDLSATTTNNEGVGEIDSLRRTTRFSSGTQNTTGTHSTSTDTAPSLPGLAQGSLIKPTSVPYYTIPNGSTVANARLLSPLIGEVPVNGQLQAPAFPFKAILSRRQTSQMFAANGIPLPAGISGTVLQGYSVGNMSLGCTRPYVTRILFVFTNGHYVVYPKETESGNKGNDATAVYPNNAIGYLSDVYNNPCITGKYITNAPKVIASLSGFGAVSGIGQAIAQAQTQTLSNISQGTTGTIFNGSLGKYGAGIAADQAASAALNWYKSRVNNIFDVVFVSSTLNGQPRQLIFNVTKTIPIDLNTVGRTLRYEQDSQLSGIDHSLS